MRHMAQKTLMMIREERLKKLDRLKEMGINPYPASYERSHTAERAGKELGSSVSVAGRLMSLRTHGAIAFADLIDETGKIQLFLKKEILGDTFGLVDLLDVGDVVGVEGEIVKTDSGQVSVAASKITVLAKSIRPLPAQWYGLKDVEERFRKRYLDLLLNPEVRQRFNVRTKLVRGIRRYLDNLGFWEIETPTLQPLYGGANAKPFKTHLNALDVDMYLRIADELYLKRAVIGGYERVYEICKDFRNEGVDLTHNPEFTMIEWYEAYADYFRVMDVTEGLFRHLAETIFGNTKMRIGDNTIDIGAKWPRVRMVDVINEKLGFDVDKENEKTLAKYCRDNGVEMTGGETKGQLVYMIFEHKVTNLLIQPTWIIDYPKDVSPLSKDHRSLSGWVERFEGYIGGKEICDGWSELTDPREQRERFESDLKAARKDREEAQQVDENFLEAMEYGMPPLGGIGIGIDRLTMFFTDTWSIKEVILFPTLRPEK